MKNKGGIMERRKHLLVILLMCVLISGCGRGASVQEPSTQTPVLEPYSFESYEEFKEWFTCDTGNPAKALEDADKWGQEYKDFINGVLEGKYKLVRAYFGDVPLESTAVNKRVSLFKKENFNKPCIYYPSKYGVVWICYLDEEEKGIAQEKTIDEFIKYLNPNYINLHNWKEHDDIEYARVEEISFKDRTVEALIYYDGAVDSLTKYFIYDDMLVRVYGKSKKCSSEVWEEFYLVSE